MNDTLVGGLGTYNLIHRDAQAGSLRKVAGLAPSLSIALSIKSQEYVDSGTKVPGTRTVFRIDQNLLLETGGQIAPLSAYVVLARPQGSLITAANCRAIIRDLVIFLGNAVPAGDQAGLDQAIFVDGAQ